RSTPSSGGWIVEHRRSTRRAGKGDPDPLSSRPRSLRRDAATAARPGARRLGHPGSDQRDRCHPRPELGGGARGGLLLLDVPPEAERPACDQRLPQPRLQPDGGRARHRAPRGHPGGGLGGRDDGRRRLHPGAGGVPGGLRLGALPAGRPRRAPCQGHPRGRRSAGRGASGGAVMSNLSDLGHRTDRGLTERDPHAILEGILIAALAIRAERAYIYIRGEFGLGYRRMQRAVDEARAAGLVGRNIAGTDFSCEVVIHRGAGAYICGEETSLLDSLEGYRGQPRLRPPFPAVKGLYASPTVVNNVETLANLPHIVAWGPEWFRTMGTEKSPGTKVYSVSGNVARPANYEAP